MDGRFLGLGFLIICGCITPLNRELSQIANVGSLEISCVNRPEVYNEPYLGLSCSLKNLSDRPEDVSVDTAQVSSQSQKLRILGPSEIRQLELIYRGRNLDNNNVDYLAALTSTSGSDKKNLNGTAASSTGTRLLPTEKTPSPGSASHYSDLHLLSGPIAVPPRKTIVRELLIAQPGKDTLPDSLVLCFMPPHSQCISLQPYLSIDNFSSRVLNSSR